MSNPVNTGSAEAARALGEEQPVWSGTPSQWVNILPFAACGAIVVASAIAAISTQQPIVWAVAAVAALVAFWQWLTVRSTRIEVTTQRISTRTGVLTRRRRDMELYRVKDTTLHEPFFLRLVSLANIEIVSSDKTTPFLVIPAIRNAAHLREQIRLNVEKLRITRNVRELDFET